MAKGRATTKVLRRKSFLALAWLCSLPLVGFVVAAIVRLTEGLDGDALSVAGACSAGVALVWRIFRSRILLQGTAIKIVNPLTTYVIPYACVRRVELDRTGTLTVTTTASAELTATAFGGSVMDHFIGSSGRAVEEVNAAVKRGRSRSRGAASVERRVTLSWVADLSAVVAVVCGLLAFIA